MPSKLISSAQNREDLYLYALIGHIKKGFYIDVGANHADLHSVTKLYYDNGWSGINIEPNPILHKQLQLKRRRDTNLNVGASDKSGMLSFRTYPNQDGLSTFSDAIKTLHEKEGLEYEDSIVSVKKLSTILKENKVKTIDFMKIDVEGYEVEVINGNDWEKYRPKVLVIEATVRHKLKPLMKSLDYRLEFFDGLNNYYVDNRLAEEITIHNYAGRVLGGGVYSLREYDALKRLGELEKELDEASRDLTNALQALENIQGLKNSIKHSLKAAKNYTKKKIKS